MSEYSSEYSNATNTGNSPNVQKRLCKSEKEKKVSGVLGGIAEYFEIDPTIVRIIYIVFLVFYPLTFAILYVLLSIAMPSCETEKSEIEKIKAIERDKNTLIAIILLIGVILLLQTPPLSLPLFKFNNSILGIILIILALYLLKKKD